MKLLTRKEELIMLAVYRLRDEACLVTIRKFLITQTRRRWSPGNVYVPLDSLYRKNYLDYALGPIQAVQGFATNQGGHYAAEDMVSAAFTFKSGVQGVGTWCFSSFEQVDVNEIVGDKGKVRFSSFGVEPVVLETRQGRTEFPIANPPHVQQPLIQTVVDDLLGRGTCPSTGITAARTNRVMDQVLEAYRQANR